MPVHRDAVAARGGRRTPLEHALHDGEDFELLLAIARSTARTRAALRRARVALLPIGRIVPASAGITIVSAGVATPLAPGGYDHLARPARKTRPRTPRRT